jgi:hypothetical protein
VIGVAALLAALLLALSAAAPAGEWTGFLAVEARGFAHDPLFPGQRRNSGSLVASPEYYHAWDDDRSSILFSPFARLDSSDPERTHFDVRELLYQRVAERWELRAGVGRVFWGVAESQHLVDVINQTDAVENVDHEDKLGQPMVELALVGDHGTLGLFALPGFRERTFPGTPGRLRSEPRVAGERALYESSAGRHRIDFAARWTRTFGDVDLGVSHFWGTSREPRFVLGLDRPGVPVLVPFYEVIHQTGVELLATDGDWVWKLEAMRRSGQGDTFHALTGGFEYTLVGVAGSSADLGLLAELVYDERGEVAPTAFESDVFVGVRLALNDAQSTEVLAGIVRDLDSEAALFNLEGSRRLGDRWTLEVEARIWSRVSPSDAQFFLRDDDYFQVTLSRYF